MQRLGKLSNKYQKRLVRPLYANTQATPYAAVLDTTFRAADGSIDLTAGASGAFTLKSGLVPGTVVVKAAAEAIKVHDGAVGASTYGPRKAFGLLANWVGGELDDIGDENSVGVWRGPDSVFELLAPAFVDTGLAAAYAAAGNGSPVKLYAAADGRLCICTGAVGAPADDAAALTARHQVVATLIERPTATRIVVNLEV